MFESVCWITRQSVGERKRQIMRLLSSRRCSCGCNSCEQADEFRWILTQSQPSASPSDTDRKTETLPTAHHSARLSADGFSVRLSCEIQTCEGLSVPRENEEWGRPRFLWRVFRVPHSLETLHHERRTGMCVVVCVCVLEGAVLLLHTMYSYAEVPASSVTDRSFHKVNSPLPSPFQASVCFPLTPLQEVILPCCICPTLETLKESEQG